MTKKQIKELTTKKKKNIHWKAYVTWSSESITVHHVRDGQLLFYMQL